MQLALDQIRLNLDLQGQGEAKIHDSEIKLVNPPSKHPNNISKLYQKL